MKYPQVWVSIISLPVIYSWNVDKLFIHFYPIVVIQDSPRIPNSWYEDLCSLFPHWIELTYITNRIVWKLWCVTSEARSWKDMRASILLSRITHLREASHHVLKTLITSLERKTTWQGADASCQQPTRKWDLLQTIMWVSYLESRFSRALRWLWPWPPTSLQLHERPLAITTQLS